MRKNSLNHKEKNLDLQQEPPLFIASIIDKITSELNKKLEDYVIEGLKRKGFVLENRFEFENFIKQNCRCEENTDLKERIYFANDIPFFLHKYETDMGTNLITEGRTVKMSANYGSYSYL